MSGELPYNGNLPPGITQDHEEFNYRDLGTKECPVCCGIQGFVEDCEDCEGTGEVPRTEDDVASEKQAYLEYKANM